MRRGGQHGQVMLLAVAVLLVLLSAALILFDFHNVLRAKIKVESAEQAAALAGAQWQVIGLNMIGQINLIKASTLMLTEAEDIPSPEFVAPTEEKLSEEELEKRKKQHRLATRLRTLDEAQSRISFIVPLLGYMAVQQTAKQNGMSGDNGLVRYYYEDTLPLNDYKDMDIKGYLWYEPYRRLVGEIADQQCPMRCNARVSEMPEVWSNPEGSLKINGGGSTSFALLLSEEALYDAIERRDYCYWQLRKMAKLGVYLSDPWWKIEYIPGQFVQESELLPLGVRYGGGADVPTLLNSGRLDDLTISTPWNTDEELQPDSWCLYDEKWYPRTFFAESYNAQQENWVGGAWLRSDRKKGFLYEGPVCAVDGSIKTSRSMMFRTRRQAGTGLHINAPVESRSSAATVKVGNTSTDRGTNLGVVAKVLGGFNDLRSEDDAPTATEVILPVFSRGLLIPSQMPYSVSMLTKGDNALKRFLQWLATHPDINSDPPPPGGAWYLQRLRELMDPDFLLRIYNPAFPGVDTLSPEEIFAEQYYYPENASGAGWLQRAYISRRSATCPRRVIYTIVVQKNGKRVEVEKSEPAVPDNVPTELAQTYVDAKGVPRQYFEDFAGITRVYYGTEKGGYRYYMKKNGKIQTNEDISCDGELWRGRGGTMRQGKESGPSRL